MHIDPETEKLSYRWFFAAGTFAVLLSYALYTVDNRLAASKKEHAHYTEMTELRVAQNSLSSHVTDTRQLQEAVYGLRVEKVEADSTHHDHDADHH